MEAILEKEIMKKTQKNEDNIHELAKIIQQLRREIDECKEKHREQYDLMWNYIGELNGTNPKNHRRGDNPPDSIREVDGKTEA